MSNYSKAKKVKKKGTVKELQVVHTVSRLGADIIKTQEVKTPNRGPQKAQSTNHKINFSSPTKRAKTVTFDGQPIPFDLEVDDSFKKRKTLVFQFPSPSIDDDF